MSLTERLVKYSCPRMTVSIYYLTIISIISFLHEDLPAKNCTKVSKFEEFSGTRGKGKLEIRRKTM